MTVRYPRAGEAVLFEGRSHRVAYTTSFPIAAVVLRPASDGPDRYRQIPLDHWLAHATWRAGAWTLAQLPLPFEGEAA